MNMEKWKPIPHDLIGKKYLVSNLGRVMSKNHRITKSDRVISQHFNKNRGYYYVSCQVDGLRKNFIVHRIVAKAFIPNPKNYECVDHKDFDRKNNKVSNLRWCSQKMNVGYSKEAGRLKSVWGELSGMSKVSLSDVMDMKKLRESGLLHREIAKKFSLATCTVTQILNGNRWKYAKSQ